MSARTALPAMTGMAGAGGCGSAAGLPSSGHDAPARNAAAAAATPATTSAMPKRNGRRPITVILVQCSSSTPVASYSHYSIRGDLRIETGHRDIDYRPSCAAIWGPEDLRDGSRLRG